MSSRSNARPSVPPTPPPSLVLKFINLPDEAIVLCSFYAAQGDPATHAATINAARIQVFAARNKNSIVDSLHAVVDEQDTRLAVFAVVARSSSSPFNSLELDNVIVAESTSFDFNQLFPDQPPNADAAFVAPSLRRLYLLFLSALRARILSDICDTYLGRIRASCIRMRDGFLLVPPAIDSEWAFGWDDPKFCLAHCCIDLHWISSSAIAIRPVFNSTPYSRLPTNSLLRGQPVIILPYGVPAYFIARYTGSTAALSQKYRDSLHGLGAGPDWDGQGYILCWISVHNVQGDDKAVLTVWPAALTVACSSRPLTDRMPSVPEHFDVSADYTPLQHIVVQSKRTIQRLGTDFPEVAESVAGFVDAMAKEREREREKAKEERYRRLQVSVPPSGPALGGPRSTISGSASVILAPGSASDHFPSPALLTGQFASPPSEAPLLQAPPPPSASWSQPDNIQPPVSSFSAMDDYYGAQMDSMVDMATFGLLTDDDFDFFDQPEPTMAPQIEVHANDAPMVVDDFTPPLDVQDVVNMSLSGTGWTPEYAPTPPRQMLFGQPVLPSPAKTPWSLPPEPATPGLVLTQGVQTTGDPFEEIQFGQIHNVADAKYIAGKFSAAVSIPLSPAPSNEEGVDTLSMMNLQERYRWLTNPSINVIHRLKKAKRKSVDQGRRPSHSPWERGEPEWIVYPPSSPEPLPSPPSSDDESSADEDGGLFGDDDDDDSPDAQKTGREPTPVPDAVLIGPSLLHAAFSHRALFPLGVPLPVLLSSAATPGGAQPVSVPTPVSPAATGATGTPFERAQSLEPIAAAFAREIVENSTWATAWRILVEKPQRPVWNNEVVESVAVLEALPYLNSSAAADWTATFLRPPRITMEKGGNLIQIAPTALRFWEKLGLGPRAGAKHVSAFVLFEEGHDKAVVTWMELLSRTYANRGFGSHGLGKASSSENGLVPLKWELFRKTLSGIISSMASAASSSHYTVFYIVIPQVMMTPSSTFLRNILGVSGHRLKLPGAALDPDSMLIHLVPEAALSDSTLFPIVNVALSVYDRLPRVAERHGARAFFKRGLAWRASFEAPAFALARHNAAAKVELQWEWPVRYLDVVDRHMFLHIAYRVSRCGHWVLFTATDERGESNSLATWAHNADATPAELVRSVWGRTIDLARRANVEWRITIAKSGPMDRLEYEAWVVLLDMFQREADASRTQVTLLSVHNTAPVAVLPQGNAHFPKPLRSALERHSPSSAIFDSAWQRILLRSPHLHALSRLSAGQPLAEDWVIREGAADAACDIVVPLASAALWAPPTGSCTTAGHIDLFHIAGGDPSHASPAETLDAIANSYYHLEVLADARLQHAPQESGLALHLASVERMDAVLSTLVTEAVNYEELAI